MSSGLKNTNARGRETTDWDRLAQRGIFRRNISQAVLIGFLVIVSIPILLPYLWMLTISVSAKTGSIDTLVLWKSVALLTPTIIAIALLRAVYPDKRRRLIGTLMILLVALIALLYYIGGDLHSFNYRFFWKRNFMEDSRVASGFGSDQFPSVWTAFSNSLMLASVNTFLVVTTSTFAGYYLSRFAFSGRSNFLQGLLVLHAFPAMTLIIPIFLILYWTGLLDTITGVILVITTLELPFSIFIMKGFFDAVPWDIEMSAITDGASRRQAFFQVVLPQVKVGMLAVGVFAFMKGWEEYVFVRTLLFEKSNWMMSLYLFFVSDDIMGVDFGIVAAVGVFYLVPSLLIFIFCQKYLIQMSLGGIKG